MHENMHKPEGTVQFIHASALACNFQLWPGWAPSGVSNNNIVYSEIRELSGKPRDIAGKINSLGSQIICQRDLGCTDGKSRRHMKILWIGQIKRIQFQLQWNRQQWKLCNGALLPTFRRAIIAFWAQLLPLCPKDYTSGCPHGNTHTHAYAHLEVISSIPHTARPWLFSRYICLAVHTRCLSPSISLQLRSSACFECYWLLPPYAVRRLTAPWRHSAHDCYRLWGMLQKRCKQHSKALKKRCESLRRQLWRPSA